MEEVDSGHPSEEEDMEHDKPTPVSSRKASFCSTVHGFVYICTYVYTASVYLSVYKYCTCVDVRM